jgi:hypothetical protein
MTKAVQAEGTEMTEAVQAAVRTAVTDATSAGVLPKFLTTEELAELLRTSPETCRYWRHVGKGPDSFRVGRRVLCGRRR